MYRPSELKNMNLYIPKEKVTLAQLMSMSNKILIDYNDDTKEIDPDNISSDDSGDYNSDETDVDIKDESDTKTVRDLPKNMYRFNKIHPLFDSHIVILKPLTPNAAVNFIGRILPRCDQGDKEFYCLTMLTFFKLWRSGLDLKKKDESWDEAFSGHEFTHREKQII